MARLHTSTLERHSRRRGASRGITSMSRRQLDAYLLARDILRHLRAATASTASTADMRCGASPPASPA